MKYLVGYYQSWNSYTKCSIDDIDPYLYTHLIYAFVGIENNKIRVNDDYGDIQQRGFHKFNDLKDQNKSLKTLLAVGGWEEGSEPFSDMASSYESRRTFIKSCLKYIDEYDFDGIDLDWEYPCQRDGKPEDKKNFRRLVKEMSKEFEDRDLLLTVAVAAGKDVIDTSYDVPKLSKYVDFINVMTYDLNSASDGTKRVGHNAPLYSKCHRNVKSSIKAWLNAGASPNKLVLGIPAYGRSYVLDDPNQTHIGAPASKAGDPSSLGYDEISEYENSGEWEKHRDSYQRVPYIVKHRDWIGYDDTTSVKEKVNLANEYGLRGVMLYSIDTDNPRGTPSFPLTRTIRKYL